MMRRRWSTLVAGFVLSACSLLFPSVPFSPAAVASPDAATFVATLGCEQPVTAIDLTSGDEVFWRIVSDDPAGTALATITLGETPDGFTQVVALDPDWVSAGASDLGGAWLAFTIPPDYTGLDLASVFVPSEGGYSWLFGDEDVAPGTDWREYAEFVRDTGQVGERACTAVIDEPRP